MHTRFMRRTLQQFKDIFVSSKKFRRLPALLSLTGKSLDPDPVLLNAPTLDPLNSNRNYRTRFFFLKPEQRNTSNIGSWFGFFSRRSEPDPVFSGVGFGPPGSATQIELDGIRITGRVLTIEIDYIIYYIFVLTEGQVELFEWIICNAAEKNIFLKIWVANIKFPTS